MNETSFAFFTSSRPLDSIHTPRLLVVITRASHLMCTLATCPYVLLHLLSLIAVISGAEALSKASLLHRYIVFAVRTAPALHVRGDELR